MILQIVKMSKRFFPFIQVSPAAERLRYILNEDDDMPTPTLFTEMDTLQREGDELEWKESARWTTTLTLTCTLKFSHRYASTTQKHNYSCFMLFASASEIWSTSAPKMIVQIMTQRYLFANIVDIKGSMILQLHS